MFPLPLGVSDRLRCFIVTLPRPSILFLTSDLELGIFLVYSSISEDKNALILPSGYGAILCIYLFIALFA